MALSTSLHTMFTVTYVSPFNFKLCHIRKSYPLQRAHRATIYLLIVSLMKISRKMAAEKICICHVIFVVFLAFGK